MDLAVLRLYKIKEAQDTLELMENKEYKGKLQFVPRF